MTNPFIDRLRAGQPTLMLGVRGARTTDIARVAASTGHHAVLVDLEHSTMSLEVAAAICSAAHDLGLVPFVRTPEREYGAIGRLLDGRPGGGVRDQLERDVARRSASEWWAMLEQDRAALFERVRGADPQSALEGTVEHPFFGPLNWRETLLFMRLHDLDHAGQMQKIAAALGAARPA